MLFIRFISTCAISKEEKRRFLLAESFMRDEWREIFVKPQQ